MAAILASNCSSEALAKAADILRLSGVTSSSLPETELCKRWANLHLHEYELEKTCAAGRIDVLSATDRLLIEAKFASNWRAGLGQVLAYASCYASDWQSVLLLFGNRSEFDYKLIETVCGNSNVRVYWYSV